MGIKCEQAGALIDKKDSEKLSLKELIQLKLHLLNCALCKNYNAFSARFKSLFVGLKNENEVLSENEKHNIKQSLEKVSVEK